MDEAKKLNSNSSIIKYFLIVTGVIFVINLLFGDLYWGYQSFSASNLPLLRNISHHIKFFIYDLGVNYEIAGFIVFVIGLGINYLFAKIIVNKSLTNNNESSSNILTVEGIIKNSFTIAKDNFTVILGASTLWTLTIWVPYLNVGTTIGMLALVVGLSKNNQDSSSFSATSIFDPKYRKHMGEVFLLLGFITIGSSIGYAFFIIPGIVISFAWGQAMFLLIDKDLSPLEAIRASNNITYGEKITIFSGQFLLLITLGIIMSLLGFIVISIGLEILSAIFSFCFFVISFSVMLSSAIYIYGELSTKLTNK